MSIESLYYCNRLKNLNSAIEDEEYPELNLDVSQESESILGLGSKLRFH